MRRQRSARRTNAHHIAAVGSLLVAAEWDAAHLQGCGVNLAAPIALDVRTKLVEFRRKIVWNLIKHQYSPVHLTRVYCVAPVAVEP